MKEREQSARRKREEIERKREDQERKKVENEQVRGAEETPLQGIRTPNLLRSNKSYKDF